MMTRPAGLNPHRLARLMQQAIARCQLDLSGAVVLTEAASGAYVVTPVLAAMAGAKKVFAVTRSTRYGSFEEILGNTLELARMAGAARALEIIPQKSPPVIAQADIVTNSGHLRPLDGGTVAAMKATAVIPLMYESWEFRSDDVDIAACQQRGIAVAGTNERHAAVDVFSYLGVMAVKLLLDAGIAVCGSRIVLLCDNPFAPFIKRGLAGAGAEVKHFARLAEAETNRCDALMVAVTPRSGVLFSEQEAAMIAARWKGAVVAQFWGDINRDAMRRAGVEVCPAEAPARGHMGILPSAVGPEPVVRLQSGGLKVGEILWRARRAGLDCGAAIRKCVESGFGQALEANSNRLGAAAPVVNNEI
jgi:hypothetical protein